MAGILSTQELRELQDFSKNIATLAKNIQRNTDSTNKQKTIESDKVDAINKLSDVIQTSGDKIANSIESLITEMKKSRD
jgi:methyl-accepting chemotaxis protein